MAKSKHAKHLTSDEVIERVFGKGSVEKLHAYLEQEEQSRKPLKRKRKPAARKQS
jgi:hypothetical protein